MTPRYRSKPTVPKTTFGCPRSPNARSVGGHRSDIAAIAATQFLSLVKTCQQTRCLFLDYLGRQIEHQRSPARTTPWPKSPPNAAKFEQNK